jgi:hypothetical protein
MTLNLLVGSLRSRGASKCKRSHVLDTSLVAGHGPRPGLGGRKMSESTRKLNLFGLNDVDENSRSAPVSRKIRRLCFSLTQSLAPHTNNGWHLQQRLSQGNHVSACIGASRPPPPLSSRPLSQAWGSAAGAQARSGPEGNKIERAIRSSIAINLSVPELHRLCPLTPPSYQEGERLVELLVRGQRWLHAEESQHRDQKGSHRQELQPAARRERLLGHLEDGCRRARLLHRHACLQPLLELWFACC